MATMNDDELLDSMPETIRPMVASVLGLRERLAAIECTASDESGLVEAVTDASGNVRAIRLHPTARRRLDNLTLGDRVRDAVNAAAARSREEYRRVLDTVEVFGIPLGEARADPGAAARRLIADGTLGAPG
jgi:DNA-binding protein YbaB